MAGQTVYCDGWAQDYPWLARLFEAAEAAPAFKLEDLRTLLDEQQAQCWHDTVMRVRNELAGTAPVATKVCAAAPAAQRSAAQLAGGMRLRARFSRSSRARSCMDLGTPRCSGSR
ncbi:MAG: hypothetical protein U1E77_01620 [Inhella sp.]